MKSLAAAMPEPPLERSDPAPVRWSLPPPPATRSLSGRADQIIAATAADAVVSAAADDDVGTARARKPVSPGGSDDRRGPAGAAGRCLLDTLGYGDRLAGTPLERPLHEVFAFIRRRNSRPSPATRAVMTLAEQHLSKLARQAS
jgi:hypothetical protein